MNHLEDRLRTELRQEADGVRTSPDAWQANRRRVAADHSQRHQRRLRSAAAVVAILLIGSLAYAAASQSGDGGTPASGSDEAFATENLLGAPVVVETVTVDGVPTLHEAALSDMTGKGPNLCDRVEAASSGFGSCTSREPDADDPAVAIDWLSGSTGANTRGILAGVDSRVMKVQIWMTNGDMTLADLKPGGWEDTKLFAFTVPEDGPRPQRLVAYSGASGTVLQAVDLPSRFGDDWLSAAEDVCEVDGGVIPSLVFLQAVAGPNQAHVVVETPDGETHDACFPVRAQIQGADAGPRTLVLVVAPEVAEVTLGGGERNMAGLAPPQPIPGSLWKVAVITLVRDLDPSDSVVALDANGYGLDAMPLRSLS